MTRLARAFIVRARGAAVDPLARSTGFLMLGSAASAGLGFLFWIVAARQYSPTEVGVGVSFVSALLLVSGLGQLNLNSAMVRFVPVVSEGRGRLVVRLYVVAIAITAALAGGVVLLDVAGRPLTDAGLSDAGLAILFVGGAMTWTAFTLQDSVLTALRRTPIVAAEAFAYALVKLILLAVAAALGASAGIALAWVVPAALLTLLVTAGVLPRLLAHGPVGGRAAPAGRELVAFVAGNSIGSFAAMTILNGLPLLVSAVEGTESAAYFYVPWTMVTSVQMLVLAGASAATVEATAEHAHVAVMRRARNYALLVAGLATLALLALGTLLLHLFRPEYAEASLDSLRLLSLGLLPAALFAVRVAVLRARDQSRAIATSHLVSLVTTAAAALVLLAVTGIEGAALAWVGGQTAGALTAELFARRPDARRVPRAS